MRQGLTNFLLFPFLHLVSFVFSKLPLAMALSFGKFLGFLVSLFSKRRKNAYADLKAAFGDQYTARERRKLVRKHFQHLGQTAIEFVRFPLLNEAYVQQLVKIKHKERFDACVSRGKGVVLLTAHFGNWELLQIISCILGEPISVLARDQKLQNINEYMNKLRESHGSKALSRGMGMRGLYRTLEEGGLVGFVGDQDAGKQGGRILPLFGRKTSFPIGAFELAKRTGAALLPCFISRTENGSHEIFVGEELELDNDSEEIQDESIMKFIGQLEEAVKEHPEQWLWGTKRWKYSWTKRMAILSDGKLGHEKQSLAVVEKFKTLHRQYGREGMSYPTNFMNLQYKSDFHRKVFSILYFILLPWVQGRLWLLKPFLNEESYQSLQVTGADFVVSCGNSMIPLNHCLARENHGKSVVVMRPSFPHSLLRYDLAIIPEHDQGGLPEESIRTLLPPTLIDSEALLRDGDKLKEGLALPDKVTTAFFVGGDTREYRLKWTAIKTILDYLEKNAATEGDYVITTSRRTSEEIVQELKSRKESLKGCQMLIIASEDNQSHIAGGMMQVAERLIITEDSISMIAEGILAKKKVYVCTSNYQSLPKKHQKFQQVLGEHGMIQRFCPEQLEEVVKQPLQQKGIQVIEEQENKLLERLEAIL